MTVDDPASSKPRRAVAAGSSFRTVITDALRDMVPFWMGAAILSVLVVGLSFVTDLGFASAQQMRRVVASVLTLASVAVIGGLLGTRLLVHDLVNGRLGFFLRWPVGGRALWLGRLVGAWIGLIGLCAILLAPSLAVDSAPSAWFADLGVSLGQPDSSTADLARWLDLSPAVVVLGLTLGGVGVRLALLCLAWLLLTHLLATTLILRSTWSLLDLVALGAVGAVLAESVHALARWEAVMSSRLLLQLLLLGFLALVVIAGARQLESGRVRVDRSHAAFSSTLWPLVALLLAVGSVWVSWATSPSADEFSDAGVVRRTEDGARLLLWGRFAGRGDVAGMLEIDIESGTRRLIGPGGGASTFAHAAAAPRFVVARCPGLGRDDCNLEWHDRSTGRVEALPFQVSGRWAPLAISPDGRTVALQPRDDADSLVIWDVESASPIRRIEVPALSSLHDLGDGSLWAIASSDQRLLDVDVQTGAVTELGTASTVVRSVDGRWLATSVPDPESGESIDPDAAVDLWSLDGERTPRRLDLGPTPRLGAPPLFLADGRLAVQLRMTDAELRLFAPDGTIDRAVPLPPGVWLLAGERGGALVFAKLGRESEDVSDPVVDRLAVEPWRTRSTWTLDLADGRMSRLGSGFAPIPHPGGSAPADLFRSADALFHWPAAGEPERLVGVTPWTTAATRPVL
ncbi:MAG: hypothetical protein AAGN46_14685 [Acidobacteriota bacterium]